MTHNTSYSDDWELANWKGFQKVLFRLQKRIFKAVRDGDKANARKLQNVVLSSHAVRLLVIRQGTQSNQGEKMARTEDNKTLTLKKTTPIKKNSQITYKDLETSRIARSLYPKRK